MALVWAGDDEGGPCDELHFDAPHLYYDLAADALVLNDDGTDRFFDISHPEHEPPGPRALPQRLLPADDDDDAAAGGALDAASRDAAEAYTHARSSLAHDATPARDGAPFGAAPCSAARNVDDSPARSARARRSPVARCGGPLGELVTGPNGTVVRVRRAAAEADANRAPAAKALSLIHI